MAQEERITIRLSQSDAQFLRKAAQATSLSVAAFVRKLLWLALPPSVPSVESVKATFQQLARIDLEEGDVEELRFQSMMRQLYEGREALQAMEQLITRQRQEIEHLLQEALAALKKVGIAAPGHPLAGATHTDLLNHGSNHLPSLGGGASFGGAQQAEKSTTRRAYLWQDN